MDFIKHINNESWGVSTFIMEKNGNAMAHCYYYNDCKEVIYLDTLNVSEEYRRQRLGTKLQEIREDIGRSVGAKKSMLFVDKNSWMREWYKRRGYIDEEECENPDFIWMEKKLL